MVDALASGASALMGVEVRVFSWAPRYKHPIADTAHTGHTEHTGAPSASDAVARLHWNIDIFINI